jgi:hypothetical protein
MFASNRTCSDTEGFTLERACSKCESSIRADELIDDIPLSRNSMLSSKAVMAASFTWRRHVQTVS